MQISKVMNRCFVSEPAKTEADHFGTQQIWASELQKFDQSSDLAVLSWSMAQTHVRRFTRLSATRAKQMDFEAN